MKLIDFSLPVYNGMWHYRTEWKNNISEIESVLKGGSATVYRFDLCSHCGTYIETSHHKLKKEILLSDFEIREFYRTIKLIIVKTNSKNEITLQSVLDALEQKNIFIKKNDSVIISTGYGKEHRTKNYLKKSPSFSPELTSYLCSKKISFLGVDTPLIENLENPYRPVVKLFEANPQMLLLAPLLIETSQVKTGIYQLSALPLKIENVSASPCRPVLIIN